MTGQWSEAGQRLVINVLVASTCVTAITQLSRAPDQVAGPWLAVPVALGLGITAGVALLRSVGLLPVVLSVAPDRSGGPPS
jgi:hypothetical protein